MLAGVLLRAHQEKDGIDRLRVALGYGLVLKTKIVKGNAHPGLATHHDHFWLRDVGEPVMGQRHPVRNGRGSVP